MQTGWRMASLFAVAIAAALFGWLAVTLPASSPRSTEQGQTEWPPVALGQPMLQPGGSSGTGAIRFAAVGDSITQGDSPDFSLGWTGSLSWVTYARSSTLVFSGGWAAGGATSARMAANARPVKADVLVILAGTNDLATGVPFAQTVANLERIVATVGAPRVVVSAVPPRNGSPDATVAFNVELHAAVLAHGWMWTDGPVGLREGTLYAPGMSRDGIHPNQAGAEVLGRALADAMRRDVG